MPDTIPERLRWAVDCLALDPADQVLEIGCGAGAAVTLVCERLVQGRILAVDRSAAMVAQARRRNQACVDAGRAVIEQGDFQSLDFQLLDFESGDFSPQHFNKIFAFNVSLFWTPPARALGLLKPLLLPGGAVYLFHQPPSEAKVQPVLDALTQLLPQYGFAVAEVMVKELTPAPVVCVKAR